MTAALAGMRWVRLAEECSQRLEFPTRVGGHLIGGPSAVFGLGTNNQVYENLASWAPNPGFNGWVQVTG